MSLFGLPRLHNNKKNEDDERKSSKGGNFDNCEDFNKANKAKVIYALSHAGNTHSVQTDATTSACNNSIKLDKPAVATSACNNSIQLDKPAVASSSYVTKPKDNQNEPLTHKKRFALLMDKERSKFVNGTVGKKYAVKVDSLSDLYTGKIIKSIKCDFCDRANNVLEPDSLGIYWSKTDSGFIVYGEPKIAIDVKVFLSVWFSERKVNSQPDANYEFVFYINANSALLWKDIEPDWNSIGGFKKEHAKTDVIEKNLSIPKNVIAASKRGRSHAHEGRPRDDDFKIAHLENGWYVIAVADGAGSAKLSRVGSELACNSVIDTFKEKLKYSEINDNVGAFIADKKATSGLLCVREIMINAAKDAKDSISNFVKEHSDKKLEDRDLSTTLLFTICKKYEKEWFIASFWVGDGAIALYRSTGEKAARIKLLGSPDSGEYGGQTRFLTMSEIFENSPAQRFVVSCPEDFEALFLMTDGITDPKFETDDNLNNSEKWDEFVNELKQEVSYDKLPAVYASKKLLNWLDFFVKGNHDDRTIAIMY